MAPPENTAFQASVLSVVAGYADTIGYLSFGAFAGLMTGNTVLLGIALVSHESLRALQNLLIIAMFLSGVGASAVLRRVGFTLPMLLALEALALVAAAFLAANVAAPTLAFAMGIQNAAATRFSGATLNTVFLTGNLQKLTQAVVSRVAGTRPQQSDDGTGVLALVYASYFIGVLLGAGAQLYVRRPLLLAVLLLPVALLRFRRTTDTAAGTRDCG
jgi:uncharacterized membrane protein YoaK (UPF0700 family)